MGSRSEQGQDGPANVGWTVPEGLAGDLEGAVGGESPGSGSTQAQGSKEVLATLLLLKNFVDNLLEGPSRV